MVAKSILLIAGLLILNIGKAQEKKRTEFEWSEPARYTAVDDNAYPQELIVVRDLEYLHLGMLPHQVPGEKVQTRNAGTFTMQFTTYHFRTAESIRRFLEDPRYLSPAYYEFLFDARIIREGDQVIDLSMANCELKRALDSVYGRWYSTYGFKGVDLRPGDQLEVILSKRSRAVLVREEILVQGPHPIMEKQLTINAWDMPLLMVNTYNGFPPVVIDTIGGRLVRQWVFHDLQPVQHHPYSVSHFGLPFYSLATGWHQGPEGRLQEFLRGHPYQRYSGRKHQHAFLDHLNGRIRVLGTNDRTVLVRDIATFIRDSITMVPDAEIDNQEPVGWHFHQRRLSEEKLLILYRHMFTIMEAPLYICFARDRYLATLEQTELYGEQLTDHVLAFKETGSERVHYIAGNTITEKYLMDELPYWLAGQMAFMIELDNVKLKPERQIIKLPTLKPPDNLLSERYLVELQEDRLPMCKGRGVVTGAMRQCWDRDPGAAMRDPYVRPDLKSPPARHVAVDSMRLELGVPCKVSYHFTPLPPAVGASVQGGDSLLEVDLARMVAPPSFGTSATSVAPGSLLPYAYAQRYDVILAFPTDVEMIAPQPIAVENTFGAINITCEQRDPRTIHWHLDHALTNTWVDKSMQAMYLELMGTLSATAPFKVLVRKL